MAAVTTAVIGIASAAVSATMQFEAAAKAKEAAKEADAAAAEAIREAKAKAEVDHYAGLNVPLDAYEAEFENNLAVAQQNTEALQEGDARLLSGGVGRVGAQAAETAEKTRIAMGEELSDLNMMKADSKDAINQQLISMDVAFAKEQNMRKADADAAYAANISGGVQSVGAGLESAASLAPLYGQSRADRRGGKIASQYTDQKPEGMSDRVWAAKQGDLDLTRDKFKQLKGGGGKWNTETNQWDFDS